MRAESGNERDQLLYDKLVGGNLLKYNVGLVMTNGDLHEIRDKLTANKIQAPARQGAVAPMDGVSLCQEFWNGFGGVYFCIFAFPKKLVRFYKNAFVCVHKMRLRLSRKLRHKKIAVWSSFFFLFCAVVVPAGNTGLEPTKTSFFQALNIGTKITKGTVEILKDEKVITKGEKVPLSHLIPV